MDQVISDDHPFTIASSPTESGRIRLLATAPPSWAGETGRLDADRARAPVRRRCGQGLLPVLSASDVDRLGPRPQASRRGPAPHPRGRVLTLTLEKGDGDHASLPSHGDVRGCGRDRTGMRGGQRRDHANALCGLSESRLGIQRSPLRAIGAERRGPLPGRGEAARDRVTTPRPRRLFPAWPTFLRGE